MHFNLLLLTFQFTIITHHITYNHYTNYYNIKMTQHHSQFLQSNQVVRAHTQTRTHA